MDREWLERTLSDLEREGVLGAHQRQVVYDRLATQLQPPKDGMGRFVAIIAMLGALLVAAGILLFFAANWEAMPKSVKLLLIFGSIAATHHYGFFLAEDPNRSPRTGRALTAIGVLLFGAAVGLIAQIYHLTSHYPWVVLIWSVTSVPFAVLTRSRAIFAIVVLLFFAWLGGHVGVWLDDRDYFFDREWIAAYGTLGVGVAAVLKVVIIRLRATSFAHFAETLRLFSAPCVVAGVYALSFHSVFDDRAAPAVEWLALLPSAIAIGLATIGAAHGAITQRSRADALDGLALVCAWVVLVAGIQFYPAASVVIANLVLFVGLLGLITRGIQLGVPAYVNYGILGFLVAVITRYFEYLDAFMDPFLHFLGAGFLMLGFGWFLEKKRKVWIEQAKSVVPQRVPMEGPR